MPHASQHHRRNTVPPVHLAQLMSTIGPTRAAQQLGVSTTMLHKARKENEVTRVVEVAAESILGHLPNPAPVKVARSAAPPPPDAMFLIAVSRDKAPVIEKMAEILGAELVSA